MKAVTREGEPPATASPGPTTLYLVRCVNRHNAVVRPPVGPPVRFDPERGYVAEVADELAST